MGTTHARTPIYVCHRDVDDGLLMYSPPTTHTHHEPSQFNQSTKPQEPPNKTKIHSAFFP